MEKEDRWKKLEVWKLADDLAYRLYKVTSNFPKGELYGLTSQLRRAALSVPTNIVEGYSRRGDRELARFLDISLGSLAEVKYLLHFSQKMGFIHEANYKGLSEATDQLGRKLWKFYEKIRKG